MGSSRTPLHALFSEKDMTPASYLPGHGLIASHATRCLEKLLSAAASALKRCLLPMHYPPRRPARFPRSLCTLLRLSLLALPLLGLGARAASADEHLWLKVDGPRIVTSAASEGGPRTFVPVGIGYCRDVIIRAQDDAVMKFSKERGLNTVRLAFYSLYFNSKKDRPIDIEKHIETHIEPVVAAARKQGLYVILDAHEYMSEAVDEAKAREDQKVKG